MCKLPFEQEYFEGADATREKRICWRKDAHFGMFIHWGLYSVLGRHAWVMNRERIPLEEDAKIADRFHPKPRAVWWNLNTGWAYAPRTHSVKTAETIPSSMQRAQAKGADFFWLNVGPRPWGDIHPEEQAALRRIGQLRRATACTVS